MAERFITPAPLPTDREREILIIIMEEAAEVQHRAAKALRFGLSEIQPGQGLDNASRLSDEIGDLGAILDVAKQEGLISDRRMSAAFHAKKEKLATFMQTEKADG